MGCAQSRESNNNRDRSHHHQRSQRRQPHPNHDWDEKTSSYAPHRPQPTHQRRRQQHHHHHQDDPDAAHAQRKRDAAERDVNRQALKQYGVSGEEKARLRTNYRQQVGRKVAEERARGRDVERWRRREGRRKREEEITVYASPELKSRWSDWST